MALDRIARPAVAMLETRIVIVPEIVVSARAAGYVI